MATQIISRPQWNDSNEDNVLMWNEGIYRTPSGHAMPNYKELLLAPRKKKNVVSRRRNVLSPNDCPIRKRLDFDSILVDSCCKPSSTKDPDISLIRTTSDKKRKPNRDVEFAGLHCDTLARPFEELQVTSKNACKRVKFEDAGKIEEQNLPMPKQHSLTNEDFEVVKAPRGNSSLPLLSQEVSLGKEEGTKSLQTKDEVMRSLLTYEDNVSTPSSACPQLTEIEEKDKNEKTPGEWEFDFLTPIIDPGYRSGPKPELNAQSATHSSKLAPSLGDNNNVDMVIRKKARRISFSSDNYSNSSNNSACSTGTKRSKSARSLKFL